jgi:hypothetical protein
MANHLENMARRLESDPFFLACPLKLYQKSEGLTEDMFAAALKGSKKALLSVRLCRAPASEEESFHDNIERIASRFSVDADALAEAVRRGQALFHMTRERNASGTLLAARDGERERATDQEKGGSP